jgi:hypothetical protein
MVKSGLLVLDINSRPYLIRGEDLRAFIKRKNAKYEVSLQPDELFCVTCKKGVKSNLDDLKILFTQRKVGNSRQVLLKGKCENCNTKLNRFSTESRIVELIKLGVIDQKHIEVLIDTKKGV